MGKVVLIVGSESTLGRKLVDKELNRGNRVAAPVASKGSNQGDNSRENLLVLPWNRSSVFSAKTVIRETIRVLGVPDRALFLNPLTQEAPFFQETTVSDLDEQIDQGIRGMVYLFRELYQIYLEKQGTFAFVLRGGKKESPLQQGNLGYFQHFADAILLENRTTRNCCGFLSDSPNIDGYADFILTFLDNLPEKARGEWLKHSDRKNLFSSLPIEKRS